MSAINCDIRINIEGVPPLHSDKELDAFLWEHRASFESLKDISIDKTFSLSLDEASEAQARLEESFKDSFEDVLKHAAKTKKACDAGTAAAIGVTTMHQYIGRINKWADPVSSYSRTSDPIFVNLKKTGKALSEINSIMDKRNKRRNDYGTDVHKMMENAFGASKDGSVSDPLSDKDGSAGMEIIHDSGLRSQTYDMCKNIAGMIKARHPRAKAIYTEKQVYSKHVDNEYLKILNAVENVKSKSGHEWTHIVGIFDLIVIDEHGVAHIYDYKTSSKEFGNSWNDSNWHEDKRHGYEAQLMAYKAMLEQYGIKVGSVNIVSIVGEEDTDASIENFTFKLFKFDKIVEIPMGGPYDVDAKLKFKTQVAVDTQLITKLHTLFNSVYPGVSEKMKTTLRERTVEELEKSSFVVKVDPIKRKDRAEWIIKTEKILGIDDIPCFSEEDKQQKLKEYVERLNAVRKTEMQTFGESLARLCQLRDLDQFEDWVKTISSSNVLQNIKTFKKYVVNGWTLLDSPDLLSNGILVFQLGNTRSEIVMLGVENMDHIIKLEKGSTILGTRVSDTEFGADRSYVLNSSVGHLLEMKAMMFIAQNPELFEICKVSSIKAVSLHHLQVVSDLGSRLIENYRRLWNRYQNDEIKIPYLRNELFMDDAVACIKRAEDIISSAGIDLRNTKLFTKLSDQYTIDNIDEILDLIKKLEYERPELKNFNSLSPNDPMFMAYAELLKAYQSVLVPEDAGITHETAKGELFNGRWNPDGTFMTSFSISSSENLRRFDRVRNLFSRKITLEFEEKYARPWQRHMEAIQKELQEQERVNTSVGGEWRFFKEWFVLDNEGKPTTEFKLKDPHSDPYFATRPAQKKACEFFLNCINEGRIGNDKIRDRFEVPLIRGDFWEQIANVGAMTAIKEHLKNFWDPIREGFMGADDSARDDERLGRNDTISLWNPMLGWDAIQRSEQIEKNGVEYYSTNLDNIFLVTMAWNTKVNACKRFLPALQGFRVLLRLENETNNAKMEEIESAMVKYIGRILYNQNVMDPSYAVAYGLLATMKGVVSKISLGFKLSALFREAGTTSINIAVNKAFGSGHGALLHDFDEASYTSALVEMGQMTKNSYSILSKVQQINAMFGISDFGFSKMAESSKTNRFAPLNVDDSIAYWTSSASDFYHRNAMLVMKLKSIGAWDAYLENENGDIYYDWTKDQRFQVFQKYEKYSDVPYNLKQQWRDEQELYKVCLDEWRSLGDEYLKLEYGDPLPHALTPSELGTLKTQSDVLFGNYDEETKSVMMHTFLGSLFMQFKIYGYARLLRYIKSPGAVNVILNEPKKEINKEGKLEEVCMVVSEDGTNAEIKFKSQVTDEEWESNRARVIREKNGAYMEGNFQTIFKTFAAISTMNLEEFKKILEDPVKKYNLLMALWDSLFAMLFSTLLGVIFGEDAIDNMSEEEWFTRWSYSVASGIATDGPIWEVARGIYSDGTLPLLSSLKRYANTASSVLAGNTNIMSAITNTFGATKELSGYFDN